MARPFAILRALWVAYRRDWTAFQSLAGNNFFLITAFLLRQAGIFVYLIMGLVVLFPMSTDPLRKIPPSRLALWPLERRERWILRLASPWINPLTWGLAGLAVWGHEVQVGYFAQDHSDSITRGTTAIGWLHDFDPQASQEELRGLLGQIELFFGVLDPLFSSRNRQRCGSGDLCGRFLRGLT